jgi:hypothetical protein
MLRIGFFCYVLPLNLKLIVRIELKKFLCINGIYTYNL